jgi:hypothetical protein
MRKENLNMPTTDQREIVVKILANGQPVTMTSSSPLRQLEISVSTADFAGKHEVELHFVLDLDGRIGWTGQSPHVKPPV